MLPARGTRGAVHPIPLFLPDSVSLTFCIVLFVLFTCPYLFSLSHLFTCPYLFSLSCLHALTCFDILSSCCKNDVYLRTRVYWLYCNIMYKQLKQITNRHLRRIGGKRLRGLENRPVYCVFFFFFFFFLGGGGGGEGEEKYWGWVWRNPESFWKTASRIGK